MKTKDVKAYQGVVETAEGRKGRWRRRLSLAQRNVGTEERLQRRRWQLREGGAWERDARPDDAPEVLPHVVMDFDHSYAQDFDAYHEAGDMVNAGSGQLQRVSLRQPKTPLSEANWYRLWILIAVLVWYSYSAFTGVLEAANSYHFLVGYLSIVLYGVPILLGIRVALTCRRVGACDSCCLRQRPIEDSPEDKLPTRSAMVSTLYALISSSWVRFHVVLLAL